MPPKVAVLFPPPDQPLPKDSQYTMEVVGAAITKVQTMQGGKRVAVSAMALSEDALLAFRFRLPNHCRTIREFFRVAGAHWNSGITRGNHTYTVDTGAFLVALTGMVIGQDRVPEGLQKPPKTIYVMDEVKTRTIPLPAD